MTRWLILAISIHDNSLLQNHAKTWDHQAVTHPYELEQQINTFSENVGYDPCDGPNTKFLSDLGSDFYLENDNKVI